MSFIISIMYTVNYFFLPLNCNLIIAFFDIYLYGTLDKKILNEYIKIEEKTNRTEK